MMAVRNFLNELTVCVCACLVAQSCPTSCIPMDGSPPGSSVHGVLQARTLEWALEWVGMPSSRGSSLPRDRTWVSCISRWALYHWATYESSKDEALLHSQEFILPWPAFNLIFQVIRSFLTNCSFYFPSFLIQGVHWNFSFHVEMQADAIKVESIRKGFQNDASNLNQHFAFWATAHLVMIITVILIHQCRCLLKFSLGFVLFCVGSAEGDWPGNILPHAALSDIRMKIISAL